MANRSQARWRMWAVRVATGAVITVAGAAATDLYKRFRTAVGSIATSVGSPANPDSPLTLVVAPTFRSTEFRGFLFFGHTNYQVLYQVKLTNSTASDARRLPIQFNSNAGYLTEVSFPPIVRSTLIGGGPTSEWLDDNHTNQVRSLGFEIDQPSMNSEITMSVVVESTSRFPDDSDLSVQIMLPSMLVAATGTSVSWGDAK